MQPYFKIFWIFQQVNSQSEYHINIVEYDPVKELHMD